METNVGNSTGGTGRAHAEALLQTALGQPTALFREGQWEAINALVNHRQKLLVVQRTGWGKSSVYFISTRIFRDRGEGPTVIISPLLALMRNQVEAATRLGINAKAINSANPKEWDAIKQEIRDDKIDVLLISPERLSNEDFEEAILRPMADRIGLFVVDEVHCISDWGHDFRPDYRRLNNILQAMPTNMPVLGTTATANKRVIKDVNRQLSDMKIQRGPLGRDSLSLQTLRLPQEAERLAWLAERIPDLAGTGIVYVIKKRDAEKVAGWLRTQGIKARAYHSEITSQEFSDTNKCRQDLENKLLENKIKVLVATTALGMGYDKPDLEFVIHYQAPSSLVAYYQQVGRAGRGIESAIGVLLAGEKDGDTYRYFRDVAFPPEEDVVAVLSALNTEGELTTSQLANRLKINSKPIRKVLKFLSVENPRPIINVGNRWRRTATKYRMDRNHINHLTRQRELEWKEVQEYIDANVCLMFHLRYALDDENEIVDCGRCAHCIGEPILEPGITPGKLDAAKRFLNELEFPLTLNKKPPADGFKEYDFLKNSTHFQASEGRVLSWWRDGGLGEIVADDKHDGHFRDGLVVAVAEMMEKRWRPDPPPQWVTCVPSLNHPTLVPDFSKRLAARLELPFRAVISKARKNEPQKNQRTNVQQCMNLDGAFKLPTKVDDGPVLLVDDVTDSGWTMTVLAALLRRAGSGPVYPVALASSKPDEGG